MEINEKNQLALYDVMFHAMRDKIRMVMVSIGKLGTNIPSGLYPPVTEGEGKSIANLKRMLELQEEALGYYHTKLQEGQFHDIDVQSVLTAYRNANTVMEQVGEVLGALLVRAST